MIGVLDIRKRGVKAIEEELSDKSVGIIGYRGKRKYIVMDIDEYERLREAELTKRLQEITSQNIKPRTAKEHINEVERLLNEDV